MLTVHGQRGLCHCMLARAIAARTKPRFIEIPREKRNTVPFTEESLRRCVVG